MTLFNHRNFIATASLASFGIASGRVLGDRDSNPGFENGDWIDEIATYRKIDAYCTSQPRMKEADLFGINKMFVANPMIWSTWTPTDFRKANDKTLEIMKSFPDRVIGQMTINPHFFKESMAEIERCVDHGMVGTRLYYQAKINDPIYFPFIERFIDLGMIIFMHGEAQLGVGGYKMQYDVGRPATISSPQDFVDVAARYPEGIFHFAHIGGGGDWEFMCKSFMDSLNIYVDIGGSNNEEGMVDFAIACLGENRVFFGTDNSYFQAVGKVMSSGLSEQQRRKVYYENYASVLKLGGHHVD